MQAARDCHGLGGEDILKGWTDILKGRTVEVCLDPIQKAGLQALSFFFIFLPVFLLLFNY